MKKTKCFAKCKIFYSQLFTNIREYHYYSIFMLKWGKDCPSPWGRAAKRDQDQSSPGPLKATIWDQDTTGHQKPAANSVHKDSPTQKL